MIDRSEEEELVSVGKLIFDASQNVLDAIAFDLFSRYGGESFSNSGVEQSQIIIDFCLGSYRRPRIGGRNFLLNGNGRSNAFDFIYLWFIELSHKLSGIGRKTFYITALTLCVKGIKYQRRLSGSRQSGNYRHLISWEYRINPFKVVELSSFNDNVLFGV